MKEEEIFLEQLVGQGQKEVLVGLELMVNGINGSCRVLSVSVSKVGIIVSTSTCLSRLELRREDQTSASNSPPE